MPPKNAGTENSGFVAPALSPAEWRNLCAVVGMHGLAIPNVGYERVAKMTGHKHVRNAKQATKRLFAKLRDQALKLPDAGNLAGVNSADLQEYTHATDDEDDAPEPHLLPVPFVKGKKPPVAPRKVVKKGTKAAKTASVPITAAKSTAEYPRKNAARAASRSQAKNFTRASILNTSEKEEDEEMEESSNKEYKEYSGDETEDS